MIKHVDYFIPEERISVEEIFRKIGKSKLPVYFETADDGISYFKNVLHLERVSDAVNLNENDLLEKIIGKNLDEGNFDPSDVDLIIIVDDALKRGSRMANLGQFMQYTYGFKKSDVIVISGNHCANVEFAIQYGELLLRSGELNSILIIAINKVNNYDDRLIGNYAVLGDGIGLILLTGETGSGTRVNGSFSLTNGVFYEADIDKADPILLYKSYMICISGLLKKYKLKPTSISEVIIQNANYLGIMECLKGLGFSPHQVNTENLTKFGHIDCVDFIVNLKSIISRNDEKERKIISFGNGTAGSNICLYLEII